VTAAHSFFSFAASEEASLFSGEGERDSAQRGSALRGGADDAALVERLRVGDESAFDRVVGAYGERLTRFALLYTNDMDDAEDVVADVLAALWGARENLVVRSDLETYLFGAVRNKARQGHRNVSRRHAAAARFIADEGVSPAMGAPVPLPDVMAAEDELLARRLRQAIEELPERARAAMALRWDEQLEYDAVAAVLGISVAAARQTVHRAILAIREKLAE